MANATIFIGKLLNMAVGMLLTVIIVRTVGEASFGLYAFCVSVVALLSVPQLEGLNKLVTRDSCELDDEEVKVIPNFMIESVICALIATILSYLIISLNLNLAAQNHSELIIAIFLVAYFSSLSITSYAVGSLRSELLPVAASIGGLYFRPIVHLLGIGFLVLFQNTSETTLLYTYLLSFICLSLFSVFVLKGHQYATWLCEIGLV